MPLFAGLDTGEHICADGWVVYVCPNWDSTDPFYDVECKRVSHRIYYKHQVRVRIFVDKRTHRCISRVLGLTWPPKQGTWTLDFGLVM